MAQGAVVDPLRSLARELSPAMDITKKEKKKFRLTILKIQGALIKNNTPIYIFSMKKFKKKSDPPDISMIFSHNIIGPCVHKGLVYF